jgi:hypothetical protein
MAFDDFWFNDDPSGTPPATLDDSPYPVVRRGQFAPGGPSAPAPPPVADSRDQQGGPTLGSGRMSKMQAFLLMLKPYRRALELKAFADDLAFKREQQAYQRAQMRLNIEQRRRDMAVDDFNQRLALDSMGYKPVVPGTAGDFQAALGGRAKPVDTPWGRYSQPTPAQRDQYAVEAARRKGRLAGEEASAREDVTNPEVQFNVETGLPAPFNMATQTAREKDRQKVIDEAVKRAHPNLRFERFGPNGAGDYTLVGTNPTTGEEKVRRVIRGAGKGSATALPLSSYQPTPQDYGAKSWTDMLPNPAYKAALNDAAAMAQREADRQNAKYPDKQTTMQEQLDYMRRWGDIKLPPEKITAAEYAKKYPEIGKQKAAERYRRDRQSGTTTDAPAAKPTAPDSRVRGQAMKAANVPEAARRLGMSVEEFSRWWHASGGRILQ